MRTPWLLWLMCLSVTRSFRPLEHMRTIIVQNKTFPAAEAWLVLTLASECKCRLRCLISRECAAWSSLPSSGAEVECRLALLGPQDVKPMDQDGAVYGYRPARLKSRIGVREWKDGLFYFIPEKNLNYVKAKEYCARVPGFRLAIFKTQQQYDLIPELSSSDGRGAFVDLRRNETGTLVWGDGTVLHPSHYPYVKDLEMENFTMFQIWNRGVRIIYYEGTRTLLCQGNDGYHWW